MAQSWSKKNNHNSRLCKPLWGFTSEYKTFFELLLGGGLTQITNHNKSADPSLALAWAGRRPGSPKGVPHLQTFSIRLCCSASPVAMARSSSPSNPPLPQAEGRCQNKPLTAIAVQDCHAHSKRKRLQPKPKDADKTPPTVPQTLHCIVRHRCPDRKAATQGEGRCQNKKPPTVFLRKLPRRTAQQPLDVSNPPLQLQSPLPRQQGRNPRRKTVSIGVPNYRVAHCRHPCQGAKPSTGAAAR